MKLFIFVFIITSFQALPGDLEKCKLFGLKAKRVMELRQTKNYLYQVIEMFDQEESFIVIDAFSKDHINTMEQLEIKIDSYGERSYSDESRKYDEMVSDQENIIKSFEVKYLLMCLKK